MYTLLFLKAFENEFSFRFKITIELFFCKKYRTLLSYLYFFFLHLKSCQTGYHSDTFGYKHLFHLFKDQSYRQSCHNESRRVNSRLSIIQVYHTVKKRDYSFFFLFNFTDLILTSVNDRASVELEDVAFNFD